MHRRLAVTKQKNSDIDRLSLKPVRRISLLSVVIAFALGAACMKLASSVSRKADLMMGRDEVSRVMNLVDITFRLGIDHLRPCEVKVQELHELLAAAAPTDTSQDAAFHIASILIDGSNCNRFLVHYLDSRKDLPAIPFFGGFDGIEIPGMDIAPELEDEQGLILWMLHRMNPEQRLFSPEYVAICEMSPEYARSRLVESWKYLYGE